MAKTVECVTWAAKNKAGVLLGYAEELQRRRVNLEGLWACDQGGKGAVSAVGKDAGALRRALKAMKVRFQAEKALLLGGKDKSGALVPALKKLAAAKVNVDGVTALGARGSYAALLWLKPAALAKAKRLL